MKISAKELQVKIFDVLENMSESDKTILSDYFIWAEMTGNKTQGIIKMSGSDPIQNIIPEHEIIIEKETPVSVLLNAGKNPAITATEKATKIAIKKAKETGIGIVGVNNIFSSNGAQSYYVEKIANNDLIGIMFSRSPGTVAPFGSIDSLFGTNPVGFAFPSDYEPIVFDAATSAMTFYGLIVASSKNECIPSGIGIDKNGNPTTNPNDIIDGGALTSFGNSYKASGFGMLVELMAGPLINGAFLDYKDFNQQWGATIIAINPDILTDLKKFKADCSKFVSIIRNSRTHENGKIRLPFDKSRENYKKSKETGIIEIDDIIYNKVFGNK
jgi:LDH2 family malate/lactate/ureidoglycolate dehydrogenase